MSKSEHKIGLDIEHAVTMLKLLTALLRYQGGYITTLLKQINSIPESKINQPLAKALDLSNSLTILNADIRGKIGRDLFDNSIVINDDKLEHVRTLLLCIISLPDVDKGIESFYEICDKMIEGKELYIYDESPVRTLYNMLCEMEDAIKSKQSPLKVIQDVKKEIERKYPIEITK